MYPSTRRHIPKENIQEESFSDMEIQYVLLLLDVYQNKLLPQNWRLS